jgi:hypothetical protein
MKAVTLAKPPPARRSHDRDQDQRGKGALMTQPPTPPVVRETNTRPFYGFHARLPELVEATSAPMMLSSVSVDTSDHLNGEAVTAGFGLRLPDGTYVNCWISARYVEDKLEVRSWTEAGHPKMVNHKLENPNPHWFVGSEVNPEVHP